MAGTLADMKARIVAELGGRADLATQIADAINTAIAVYQRERFRFSDTFPTTPIVFNTAPGVDVYTATSNPNIGTLQGIDYALALIGNVQQQLNPVTPANATIFNQSGQMRGQPMWYAYEGNAFRLSPMPDQVYQITLGLFRSVAAPADDAEVGNPWMTDGELLIRSRAKFEIATHVTRNQVMAEAMSPFPAPGGKSTGHAAYWAWKTLKGEAARATGTGRVRPMQF